MMVSIDNLAHRYGLLPSEAIARGTTFDLEVLDISSKFEQYKLAKLKNNGKPTAPVLTQEQMLEMLAKVKKKG